MATQLNTTLALIPQARDPWSFDLTYEIRLSPLHFVVTVRWLCPNFGPLGNNMKRLPIEFRLAIIVALVACTLASLLWLDGDAYMGDGYLFGDKVYKLGWPFTEIVFAYARHHGPLTRTDDAWAIPTMDLLLTLQLLCWACLFTLVRRFAPARKNESKA